MASKVVTTSVGALAACGVPGWGTDTSATVTMTQPRWGGRDKEADAMPDGTSVRREAERTVDDTTMLADFNRTQAGKK